MRFTRLVGAAAVGWSLLATSSVLVPTAAGAAHTTELGINIMVYDTWANDADPLAAADQTFAYVEGLGATAVALNFSFSMDSATGSTISAGPTTPSPALLGSLIDEARADGLAVELRPLLDESTVAPRWRGNIAPADPKAWFASYGRFLAPYVALSTSHQVHRFVLGAELVSMVHYAKQWKHLIAGIAPTTTSSGTELSVDGNWEPVVGVAGVGYGMDFYQPVILPPATKPTVKAFQAAMHANLTGIFSGPRSTAPVPLRQLVLSEVGIGAVSGAWVQPYQTYNGQRPTIRRSVQAHWFTAACQEAKADHLKGIYFWTVFLSPWTSPAEDDSASPYEWVGTASADAIRSCFTG